MAYYRDRKPNEILVEMKEKVESEKFDDNYIRNLIAMQKGELSVKSKFYDGKIAEGNWSLIDDLDIRKLDETIRIDDTICGIVSLPDDKYKSKKTEYEYVFKASCYAVETLILYYLEDYKCTDKQAKRVYNLKNAVIRREGDKFYGGLPFILKYIDWILAYRSSYLKEYETKDGESEDLISLNKKVFEESIFNNTLKELGGFIKKIFDFSNKLDANKINDEFINDIIDCLMKSCCEQLILEMRIEHFNVEKEKWYCVDFYDEIKEKKEISLNYMSENGFRILMHRDVKKDFNHLQKHQLKQAIEKIYKTPNHPNNEFPTDSKELKGKLKGWFKQYVNSIAKGNRLVYKKVKEDKTVYIATVSGHYENAEGRTKSTVAYKDIDDFKL